MLGDFAANEIHFTGLGASGATAAEAAERLALTLRQWSVSHPSSRVLQLSILPVASGQSVAGSAESFGAMAVIAYAETGIRPEDMASAVAAAVEEIHVAQVVPDERAEPQAPSAD